MKVKSSTADPTSYAHIEVHEVTVTHSSNLTKSFDYAYSSAPKVLITPAKTEGWDTFTDNSVTIESISSDEVEISCDTADTDATILVVGN